MSTLHTTTPIPAALLPYTAHLVRTTHIQVSMSEMATQLRSKAEGEAVARAACVQANGLLQQARFEAQQAKTEASSLRAELEQVALGGDTQLDGAGEEGVQGLTLDQMGPVVLALQVPIACGACGGAATTLPPPAPASNATSLPSILPGSAPEC